MADERVNPKASIIADRDAALRQARLLLATDPEAAVRQAQHLLRTAPDDAGLLRLAAAGLRRTGQIDEAERLEQQAVQVSTRSPEHREAARAIAGGDKDKAARILEGLITRDETDVVALVMLGLHLSVGRQYRQAENLLLRATEAAPADVPARLALAEHLHRAKRPAEALKQLDRLGAAADTIKALSLRTQVLRDLGRQVEEVAVLEKLAAIDTRAENHHLRMGHALRTLGRTDEAMAAYRAVLAANPYEGAAWWSLANLKTVTFTDGDVALMEQGVARSDTPQSKRFQLHFALGKAFEDRADSKRAFRHYDEGNRLRQQSASYRPETITAWVDGTIDLLTPEFYASRAGSGSDSNDPIFIVGMQRSGSTLVEQILDSHPAIEGTAELSDFPAIVRELGETAGRRGVSFGTHLSAMSADELRAVGDDYLARTRVHRKTDKPFFIDKMPTNWMYAGLIRLVLPKAKIVDVRRHPLACCFSNWKQLYGKGLEHCYAMDHMGRYYADYVRLMRHLEKVQPGGIHRLIYDRLVDDFEGEVRRLLDYLELPFDQACLDFHANARSVRTISAGQVRQPINRRGLDQWKPYEQWLGPLKRALGPVMEDWDA